MTTKAGALRALRRVERELRRIHTALDDLTVPVIGIELMDTARWLSELYTNRCFTIAIEHGVPLLEVLSAVANASSAAAHIGNARHIYGNDLMAMQAARDNGRENVRFAASRLAYMISLINAAPELAGKA